MYNSQEFIKSQLVVSQDGQSAHLHSADICHNITPGADRDNAFDEAVSVIKEMGWKPSEIELDTIDGGCTQHFVR